MAAGCGLVYVLLLLASLLVQSWGRMICWQAMLTCDMEEQCSFAYRQYTQACESVLAGEAAYDPSKRRCPSHCINAIIQLNSTKAGPALEDCDCANDDVCKATKRSIEPCMPRTSGSPGRGAVIGCTAARRLCERDFRCSKSMTDYLRYCGPLFNGVNCPNSCMAVISEMITQPKALLLNECVCDGMERAICESIKDSMVRLCFSSDGGPSSSGESDDDFDEDYDDPSRPTLPSSGALRAVPTLWTCIVLLVLQGYK
ncbi:growth arrest-specific protein 1 [Bufo bufo]|uniref:growth arrest-specific protein 1 n=1 Tax=Bufo bufo TaxID=8384 RepID=UPI001ABE99C9|nr:growth arrest-specific protein 1 [Bufo bufo]